MTKRQYLVVMLLSVLIIFWIESDFSLARWLDDYFCIKACY